MGNDCGSFWPCFLLVIDESRLLAHSLTRSVGFLRFWNWWNPAGPYFSFLPTPRKTKRADSRFTKSEEVSCKKGWLECAWCSLSVCLSVCLWKRANERACRGLSDTMWQVAASDATQLHNLQTHQIQCDLIALYDILKEDRERSKSTLLPRTETSFQTVKGLSWLTAIGCTFSICTELDSSICTKMEMMKKKKKENPILVLTRLSRSEVCFGV